MNSTSVSQGDDSLNRQDEQGRKGKEKLYWWRAKTRVMKETDQSQKKSAPELEKWSQGSAHLTQFLHTELVFHNEIPFKISAERRIFNLWYLVKPFFPSSSKEWDGAGIIGRDMTMAAVFREFVELEETRWSFSCSLTVFLGVVLFLCYYRIHPCFQAAVYHTNEEGELKMEQLVKRLISSSPAHRKLVNVY